MSDNTAENCSVLKIIFVLFNVISNCLEVKVKKKESAIENKLRIKNRRVFVELTEFIFTEKMRNFVT